LAHTNGVFETRVNGSYAILVASGSPPTDANNDVGVDAVVNFTVNPNDPPFNLVPANQEFLSQVGPLVFSTSTGNAIAVSDPDAGASDNLTITLSVGSGTLTLATLVGLTNVSGNGTSLITATGTTSALNTALDGLNYTPASGFFGTVALTLN